MPHRIFVVLIALATIPFSGVVAQQHLDRREYVVNFGTGQARLSPSLGHNAEALASLDDMLARVHQDTTLHLHRITLCGYASPDGVTAQNIRLSHKRRDALLNYIRTHHNLPDSMIMLASGEVAWGQLEYMVRQAAPFEGREQALEIIAGNGDGVTTDTRIARLKQLNRGRVWKYLNSKFFPSMRNASAVILTYTQTTAPAAAVDTVVAVPALAILPAAVTRPLLKTDNDTIAQTTTTVQPAATMQPATPVTPAPKQGGSAGAHRQSSRPAFTIALSTNLLYDVAGVPNVAVELPLTENISFKADWMYAWWSHEAKSRFWRIYGGDLCLRYYFGTLTDGKGGIAYRGHHLGVYGQMTTYDFEWGGRGYQALRWQCGGGVEYGYSMPIGRRLNLDLSLAVGYLGGTLSEYEPVDGHFYEDVRRTMHYVGPTSAQVSLVWLLPIGKKGGRP